MKIILRLGALLILVALSSNLYAQHKYLDTAWVSSSPDVGVGNYHTSAIVSAIGELYVTGNSKNGNGDTDIYIIKFKTNGDTAWTKTYAGNAGEDDYGVELVQKSNGDIIVVGTAKSTSGDYDYITLCYDDTTGSEHWNYVWNGAGGGIDIPADVALDASDNVFVAGGSEASNGLSDYGVVKLSSSGSHIWNYYYNYADLHDAATSITVAGTRVIVTGGSNASLGDWDLATVRINISTGAHITELRTDVPSATMEDARAMATDSLNNIYVTGYASVSGNVNMQTLKFDSTLTLVWSANYDAAGLADEAYDIAVDQNGNVFVTGFSEETANEPQATLIKYNSSGTQQWARSYQSHIPVTSISRKMEMDYNGNIFITGTVEQDTLGSFFFSQYDSDGALMLSAEYESDTLDNNGYDIVVDSNDVYIAGLSQSGSGGSTSVLKYTLLQSVNPSYFYLNGEKSYWCQQPGMYSFSLTDSTEYTNYNPNIVANSEYFDVEGIHHVFFDPGATEAQIDSMINVIENDVKFNKEYMVGTLTRHCNEHHQSEYYVGLNNHISIVFEDAEITIAEVDSFAALYETSVIYEPGSSIKGGTYILEPDRMISSYDFDSPTLTMEISRDMEEYDSLNFVKAVDPGMIMFRLDDPNDSLYNEMWWAEDTIPYLCNGTEVYPTSIDLDCAWNFQDEFGTGDYYSGEGIKIGVIDADGYQFSHPDCNGMYNYVGYVSPSSSTNFVDTFNDDYLFNFDSASAHGHNVSGIIAARFNNTTGIAGVAHNSTVVPCISHGSTDQFNSLLMHLLTLDDTNEIDVINMCFGYTGMTASEAQGFSFYFSLLNCYETGRPDPNGIEDPRGIVLVASAGNSNGNVQQAPANIPFVFSVAATNPFDQIKKKNDSFDPVEYEWGSSYFNDLDVAAPGICIWSTDFQDSVFAQDQQWPDIGVSGYGTGDYYLFSGSSASAPIVSGIAALVLEKDSMLTADEVYDVIRFSSEKVGGYSYSNNWETGRCLELGHGRVNACGALQMVDQLSVEEILPNAGFQVMHPNPIDGILPVTVNGTENYTVTIVNIMGAVVYQSSINSTSTFEVDMRQFANGIYLLNITDQDTHESQTSKVIKH